MAIAMMMQGCPYAHEAMITLVNGIHQAPRCSIKGYKKNRIIATIEVCYWQCALKARIISGGGFHPDNCR
jgi:hypothetical protein